jgi:hypothetical protein
MQILCLANEDDNRGRNDIFIFLDPKEESLDLALWWRASRTLLTKFFLCIFFKYFIFKSVFKFIKLTLCPTISIINLKFYCI